MHWRDVAELVELENGTNENGFPKTVEKSKKQVFVNKKSVRSNEFYLAAQSGFSIELMFELRSIDYESQKHIDYESKRYEVVRVYDKGDLIELICQAYGDKP